jgi:tripartite-type tricarboxylate transporter receptor subunit TctC
MSLRSLYHRFVPLLQLAATVMALGISSSPVIAHAQDYPTKPIRLIVPFPPGGQTDALGRILGKKLGERWKQQVIIDNRPGGNTIIGADLAAKSPPDGYTLLLAIDSTLTMNQTLYRKLPYDPVKDFAPIVQAVTLPLALVVNQKIPATSLKDVIVAAKANPGSLNYGAGTITTQLAGELFKSMAGVNVVYVPYKGSAPTVQGLLGGEIEMIFDGIATALPHIKSGKLRPIAVTADKRSPLMPEVPTMEEAGLSGYKVDIWLGLVAPRGTPAPILTKLNAEVNRILAEPEVKETLGALGMEPAGGTQDRFKEVLKSDTTKWTKIINEAGIRLD